MKGITPAEREVLLTARDSCAGDCLDRPVLVGEELDLRHTLVERGLLATFECQHSMHARLTAAGQVALLCDAAVRGVL